MVANLPGYALSPSAGPKMGVKQSNGGTRNGAHSPAGASCTATAIVVIASLLLVASVLVFLLSPLPQATRDDGEAQPEPVELAIGIAGHEGWLDALRAWARLASLKVRSPEPRSDLGRPASVKKAAKKSLEMGREAVEHSAESAARAAEETLEKTTEKVRRKVSHSARRHEGDL